MAEVFKKTFQVRWGEMDFNAHMRNTAYLDVAGDVRMIYFQEHGFSMREFERLRVGPVILRDELDYYRELRLLDSYDVTLSAAGLSPDASRFRLRNEYIRSDGKPIARATSIGAWLDLAARRLVRPPDELAELLRSLPRSSDFEQLESTVRDSNGG